MLKERKKLLAKVESLTRKVNNLQNKLAAATTPGTAVTTTTSVLSSVPAASSDVLVASPARVSLHLPVTAHLPIAPLPRRPVGQSPSKAIPAPRITPTSTIVPSSEPQIFATMPSTVLSTSGNKKRGLPEEFVPTAVPSTRAIVTDEVSVSRLKVALKSGTSRNAFTPTRANRPQAGPQTYGSQNGEVGKLTIPPLKIAPLDITNNPRPRTSGVSNDTLKRMGSAGLIDRLEMLKARRRQS
jgi:hypothetical protein